MVDPERPKGAKGKGLRGENGAVNCRTRSGRVEAMHGARVGSNDQNFNVKRTELSEWFVLYVHFLLLAQKKMDQKKRAPKSKRTCRSSSALAVISVLQVLWARHR